MRATITHLSHVVANTLLSVIVLFFVFVFWQTMVHHPHPLIASGEQMAYTTKAGDMILVEYERDITITRNFDGRVSRTIACENGWTHDVPVTERQFKKGQYHAMRSFLVPYVMPRASKCKMDTLISWRPPFAVNDQSFKLVPIPFIVIPNEMARKDDLIPHTHGDGHQHDHDKGLSKIHKPNTKEDMVFNKQKVYPQ